MASIAHTSYVLAETIAANAPILTLTGDADAALRLIDEGLRATDRAIALEPQDPQAHSDAQRLHAAKSGARQGQHRNAEYFEELRRAVASGEEAIRLGYHDAAQTQMITGDELVHLANDAWLSGRDPRPEGQKGVVMVEAGGSQLRDGLPVAMSRVTSLGNVAELALSVGDDPKTSLEDALRVADEALGRRPDVAYLQEYRGWLLLLEAKRRVAAGQDPGATLAEAETWLAKSVPKTDEDQGRQMLVEVAIVGARWQALNGKDPSALLRTAQARIADGVRHTPGWGNDLIAGSELEAALWAHRSGKSAEAEARRGLPAIEKVIADEPRDALTWVEKAQLEILAGDGAQAKASLEHAAVLNGLVRGSNQWKEAVALVGL